MAMEKIARFCSLTECKRPAACRGWCRHHYDMWRLHGDPHWTPRYKKVIFDTEEFWETFWSKVDKTEGLGRDGDCWEWRGWICGGVGGYGAMETEGKVHKAHRLSWQLANGRPPMLCVLHHCDNRICVNPQHLYEGTDADNVRDRENRNRHDHPKGERHSSAKITDDIVRAIRAFDKSVSWSVIVQTLGLPLSRSLVCRVRTRKTWKHVI